MDFVIFRHGVGYAQKPRPVYICVRVCVYIQYAAPCGHSDESGSSCGVCVCRVLRHALGYFCGVWGCE